MTWLGSGSRAGSHWSSETNENSRDYRPEKLQQHQCLELTVKMNHWKTKGKILTDMLVSLFRMTWSRWGGRIGGALKCFSGLKMYCSCPYGPGGELDRSGSIKMCSGCTDLFRTKSMATDSPDVSEHSRESTCSASNTSKSDFFTWIRLLIVPSWLVTTGWETEQRSWS